jgi:predicted DsbA family dithiol-disulfide isomerase
VERLKEENDLEVVWRAFPLHPETPVKGRSLEELFKGRGVDIPGLLHRLKAVADEEGLPFGERTMTFNSRRAQELGKWAETQEGGMAFHSAVFRTYFAEGRNIGDIRVLADLCRSIGLDPMQAKRIVADRSFADAVDRDWERSRRLGITAVPTLVMAGRTLVGAQPYEEMERFIRFPAFRERSST